MPKLRVRGWVPAPLDATFAFFDDPRNLGRLVPPPASMEVRRVEPSPLQTGSDVEFRYGIGPIVRSWRIRITQRVEPHTIVDETTAGPMRYFRHEHRFRPARYGTWVEDWIDYHVGPDGFLGAAIDIAAGLFIRAMFIYRHAVQRRLLARAAGRPERRSGTERDVETF